MKARSYRISVALFSPILLLILLLLVPLSLQRKTFLVKEQHPMLFTPKVSAYDASWCAFKSENYWACIDSQTQVEVGWEWDQDYGVWTGETYKYYRLRNNVYAQQSLTIHPELYLEKLYYGDVTGEIEQFQANVFWELLYFFDDNTACINVGWNSEPISMML